MCNGNMQEERELFFPLSMSFHRYGPQEFWINIDMLHFVLYLGSTMSMKVEALIILRIKAVTKR